MSIQLIPATALFQRQLIVWQKNWKNFVMLRVLEPAIMLYAMGFGLGLAFDLVNGVPYLFYVVPGIMCSANMMACIFDGLYGSLTRNMYQGLWKSQLATSISLRQILLMEALWISIKGCIATILVMLVGYTFGGITNPLLGIVALPFLLIGGFTLSSLGQFIAARANTYMDIDYAWPLVITPMFMFSGIFIPLETFPHWLQNLALLSPLYYMVELVRGTMLSTLTLPTALVFSTVLLTIAFICQTLAYNIYKKRLFT